MEGERGGGGRAYGLVEKEVRKYERGGGEKVFSGGGGDLSVGKWSRGLWNAVVRSGIRSTIMQSGIGAGMFFYGSRWHVGSREHGCLFFWVK